MDCSINIDTWSVPSCRFPVTSSDLVMSDDDPQASTSNNLVGTICHKSYKKKAQLFTLPSFWPKKKDPMCGWVQDVSSKHSS